MENKTKKRKIKVEKNLTKLKIKKVRSGKRKR